MESDLFQVCVVLSFCGILKLGCLMDVVDAVKLVNFFEVDQWNPLFSVDIHKVDLIYIIIHSNYKREVDLIIAMD